MNTITLPGFSAEASLGTEHAAYRAALAMPGDGQVVPQLRFSCLIKAAKGYLSCLDEGLLGDDTCAMFARLEYSVCDFVGG